MMTSYGVFSLALVFAAMRGFRPRGGYGGHAEGWFKALAHVFVGALFGAAAEAWAWGLPYGLWLTVAVALSIVEVFFAVETAISR